jgi:hypothetical protein
VRRFKHTRFLKTARPALTEASAIAAFATVIAEKPDRGNPVALSPRERDRVRGKGTLNLRQRAIRVVAYRSTEFRFNVRPFMHRRFLA